MYPESLITKLENALAQPGLVTVLTGAGISAESGIPTFRGPEGYWTIDSVNYHPQEMATMQMFRKRPLEVWRWYLYRYKVCRAAQPNPGHYALVELEKLLSDRFRLISQNVDGLHLRAGSSVERSMFIHGDFAYSRCSVECKRVLYPFPDLPKDQNDRISPEEFEMLRCPNCSALLRPHVLWFDETYNEHYYRYESAMEAARKTRVLIIVGTAGATTLPNLVVDAVRQTDGLIIDINPVENVFGELAEANGGYAIQHPSGEVLPELVQLIKKLI